MGTVSIKWVDSQLMVGVDSNGRPLVVGSWPEKDPNWSGLKPSDLLLLAAGACSAYDVVVSLSKQREPLKSLEISVTGSQLETPPYVFESLHLHYRVEGDVDRNKLKKAINLSEEKYCSVINTLRPSVKITSDFTIVGKSDF